MFPRNAIVTEDVHQRLQVHNVAPGGTGLATSYRFEWSAREDFQPDRQTAFIDDVPEGRGGDTAYVIADALSPAPVYYWRARVTRTPRAGEPDVAWSSDYSGTWSFRTPDAARISAAGAPSIARLSAPGPTAGTMARLTNEDREPDLLARPSGLVATPSGSGVVLTWIAPPGVTPPLRGQRRTLGRLNLLSRSPDASHATIPAVGGLLLRYLS